LIKIKHRAFAGSSQIVGKKPDFCRAFGGPKEIICRMIKLDSRLAFSFARTSVGESDGNLMAAREMQDAQGFGFHASSRLLILTR